MTTKHVWPQEAIYLLRTTQQHHVQLSLMADHKANMLMGAAFLVFSLAIGQSAAAGAVSAPVLVIAISSFVAAMLAAIATMPAVRMKAGKQPNWLFFGAYSDLGEEEFTDTMLGSMAGQEPIYRVMLRDIHQMGQVLARRKYRLLGWAYRVFITGMSLTFVLFLYERFAGPVL